MMVRDSGQSRRAVHECAEAIWPLRRLWCRSEGLETGVKSNETGRKKNGWAYIGSLRTAIDEPVLMMADVSGLVVDEALKGSAATT